MANLEGAREVPQTITHRGMKMSKVTVRSTAQITGIEGIITATIL